MSSNPIADFLDPSDSNHHSQLRGWLALQASLGLDPIRARELLRRTPDPTRLLARMPRRSGPSVPKLDASIRVLARVGARSLPIASSRYPAPLLELRDAPPLLHVIGNPTSLDGCCVGIVGARAATVSGLELARQVAHELAAAGAVVVSGLARGIDAAAHRGALEAKGMTIAVQACGPDQVYPAEHRRLADEIRERGAVVTEFPVGAPPRRPHFPLRNRLISGMSRLVIVVEARKGSGSLITARHALDQGRDVMAVPGMLTAPTSWGPNRLIRDGAPPLLEPADALDWLGLENPPPPARESAPEPALDGSPLSAEASRITSLLASEPLERDELGRRLGREPRQLALDLLDLELSGEVRPDRDGRLHLTGSGVGSRKRRADSAGGGA